MYLQLFDYLLSKLCNRQWLPKSHSYCRCRTIWHEWPCGRFLCRILVCPCQYGVVVHKLFVDIVVTPMSAAGSNVCNTFLGIKLEESSCDGVQSFPIILQSFQHRALKLDATLHRVTGATWGFEPAWLSPLLILGAGYSLEPYWIYVLHIGFWLSFFCCWHFENVSLMEHNGQLM